MSSEKEKILEMVAAKKISPEEGEQLMASIKARPASRLRVLLNPFERLSGRMAMLVAIGVAAAGVLLATVGGVRFDGAFDVHGSGQSVPILLALLDQLVAWPLLALCLFGASLVAVRQGRFVDFLAAVGVGRAVLVALGLVTVVLVPDPAALMDRVLTNSLDPVLILVGMAAIPFVVWFFVWLVMGFSTASGMRGGRLVVSFIVAVVAAEVISKTVLYLVPSPRSHVAERVLEPYQLAGETSEEKAEDFLRLLLAAEYDKASRTFNDKMGDGFDAIKLGLSWRLTRWKVGDFKSVDERKVSTREGNTIVDLDCTFESERMVVRVVFDPDGRVTGLWFRPPG
ncbi:DUF3887 domain-containing protein [Myxococcota bacterium]